MTDSIQNGRVVTEYFVFYPHVGQSALFATEHEVQSAVPTFFAKFIAPNAQRLKDRAFLKQASRTDWWGLMSPRSWSAGATPKIISKFFGGEGAFLCDVDGIHLPVMGHAWILKDGQQGEAEDEVPLSHLLFAYSALLNSEPFARLLAIYSPHVAGGQFDLSTRHVNPIPVPNLLELSAEANRGSAIEELALLGRNVDVTNPMWRARVSNLVALLYGTSAISSL